MSNRGRSSLLQRCVLLLNVSIVISKTTLYKNFLDLLREKKRIVETTIQEQTKQKTLTSSFYKGTGIRVRLSLFDGTFVNPFN